MGRPRGFDEQRAVAAAAGSFARRSYDGTSVDDLVAETGVHRGSLYKTFGSKRGLYLAALRHHVDHDVTRVAAAIAATGPAAALDDPGLGFLFLAAAERAAVDEEVAAEVGRALSLLDAAVRPVPDALARDLTAALLGLMLRGRAQPGLATGAALLAACRPSS